MSASVDRFRSPGRPALCAYGGVMPIHAVPAREYFGQRVMGTVFGAVTTNDVEYRHGVRPSAGGWIFDTFNSYGWLYLGSFSVALGAAAIVLAFPRLARARLRLA